MTRVFVQHGGPDERAAIQSVEKEAENNGNG